MSFQWLQQRIQEEKDRRLRESLTLERLPSALEELHGTLKDCIESYQAEFEGETIDSVLLPAQIEATVRDSRNTPDDRTRKVKVAIAPEIPGFRIDHANYSVTVEVGLLGNDKLYYRDQERDVYLNMEDLTRRILDPVLFPKLRD
jgi:hypothetical protein